MEERKASETPDVNRRPLTWIALLGGLVVCVILLIVLLTVNYSAGLFLILGFVAALGVFVARSAWKSLKLLVSRLPKWIRLAGILTILALLLVTGLLLWRYVLNIAKSEPMSPEEYTAVVETLSLTPPRFLVHETIVGHESFFHLLLREGCLVNVDDLSTLAVEGETGRYTISFTRQITNTNAQGFLLREVLFVPLEAQFGTCETTVRVDAHSVTSIELREFPANAFYAARDAEEVQRYPYVGTETIRWSVINPGSGIAFSYVQPPFHHLRPVLQPFIGATSFNQWIVGGVGFIVAMIFVPIAKPVLLDVAKKRFRAVIEREPRKSTKKTARIVVSPDGKEKDVEITTDDG